MNIHWKGQKPTKISTFSNLRSIVSNFPAEFCNTSSKAYRVSVQSLLNVCRPSDFKTIRKVHKMQQKRCWTFASSSNGFWNVFEVKRCSVLFQKCNAYVILSLLSWLCWKLEQNLSENVQNCIKNDKTSKSLTIHGEFEAFFLYNLSLSCNKS